jgi:hypothetical protein
MISRSASDRPHQVVQPSIDTGIKYRQDFVKQIIRSLCDGLGLTRAVIDGLHLLDHHKSLHMWVLGYPHVKRVTSISARQGADHGEAGLLVEQGVAYDKGRTTSFLLMTRLGVEGNGNEVPFLGSVRFHLPGLFARWLAPIHFFGFVARGYARHEFLQTSLTANASCWRYDDQAVLRGDVYVVTHRDMRVFKHLLREA